MRMEDTVYDKFLPEEIPLWQMPFWDSLRGDSRLEKIVATLAPKGN